MRSRRVERAARKSRTRSAVVFWLVGALILALMLAVWQARAALLMAFAAVIFATILLAVSRPLNARLGIPRGLSVPLAAVLLLALPLGAFLLIGPELRVQLSAFAEAVPEGIRSIERRFDISFEELLKDATGTSATSGNNGSRDLIADAMRLARLVVSQLGIAGSFVVSAIAGLLVVVVGGIFLASDPDRYRRGIVQLVPKGHQDRIDHAIGACGYALERWLRAQFAAMVAVGMLTGVGAWLIGLPAPLAIGVISGILEFFPIIGPWLGAVPVLLLAIGQGMQAVVLAGLLLFIIQQLEASVITPIAQDTMVKIPPFLVLFGLIAFGLVFGLVGMLVAGPLTLVAYVLVKELYIKDALGKGQQVPSTAKAEASSTNNQP
jgi:predicted PurR-regulated permease PerM